MLKNLIKETEDDLFVVKNSQSRKRITEARIRLFVRKQTVEAVDKDLTININDDYYENWQKLKKLLDIK